MTVPPPLPRPGSEPHGWPSAWPGWMLAGLVALLLGARLAEAWHLPLPLCWFKALTGLPCAFCGATRAVFALARLDLLAAVRLNPLVCVLGFGGLAAFVLWASDLWLGTRCRRRLSRWSRLPWMWIVLAALGANWIYLLATTAGR